MKEKFDYQNPPCLCGSGKLYKDCCKKKIDISKDIRIFKSYMQEFLTMHNKYKKLCLHPQQNECSNTKTHAHTISQKAVLDLISENGKVLMPLAFGITNEFRMEPLGIESKATKFYCFCSKHDGIFSPIDKQQVDYNHYNCFLYAYRTFAYTYYKVSREVDCYYKLRDKYDLTPFAPALLMYKYMEINMTYLKEIKEKFDRAIITDSYDILENIKISLDYKVYFAAATCFCLPIDLYGNIIAYEKNELPLVYISIIPDKENTNIIFSWLKEDSTIYSSFKEQISNTPTKFLLKYLNNLLPLSCENLTISPKLWSVWGAGQSEFLSLAHTALINDNISKISQEYFQERKYNLFFKL